MTMMVSSSLRHRSFILFSIWWIVVIIAVNVMGTTTPLESTSPNNADTDAKTNDEGIILHQEETLDSNGGSFLQSVVVDEEKTTTATTDVGSSKDSSTITIVSDPTTSTVETSSIMTNATSAVLSTYTQRQRKLQPMSTKIIGGVDTRRGRFPYYVGLLDKRMTLICGGSLIASDVVITAAHCQ